ncbi:hypothetical protein ACB094_08G071000 [Castanea mollissima]
MLQWMGGSRRKVANSRKSTQKRQKQYFEQRKRQQQQQTAGSESYADGMNACGEHHKEQRSLDILSLLNLSAVSQECYSTCPSGKEDLEVNASTVKYNISKGPPTILSHTVTHPDSVGFKEARSPSHCRVETESPKKVGIGAHNDNNTVFKGTESKHDQWKTATDQQLSVLDLLGDDELNGNEEVHPMHEDHVAFSVEGLGKVGMETPVHSPQQPGRYFSFACSPLKAARQVAMSKNRNSLLGDLEIEMDTMMQDINMPLCGSSLEFSSGITHSYSNPKQKSVSARTWMQHDSHDSKTNSLFDDRRIFYDRENNNEDIWDARSCFLDDNFLDEREYDVSWKNWPPETESNSMDFLKYGHLEMSDYAFEESHLLKKRDAATAMDRFNILESPASFYKHQASESDIDFMISSRARRPTLGRKLDFRDVTSQSDWFCFTTEDAKDNLSILSEESCSSSAVWGEATNHLESNAASRQRRRPSNAFAGPRKKYDVKKIFAKETWYKDTDEIGQGNDLRGSGKCTNRSNPSKSKPSHHSQGKLGQNGCWFYEDGYNSVKMNSGFSSFSRNSETKLPFSGSKIWMEDPSSELPVPRSDIDAIAEKFALHDSPISSKVKFGSTMPDLSPDSKLEGTPLGSLHLAGSHVETPFPDISAEESASREVENKAKIQPGPFKKLGLIEEICMGNGLFSENKKAIDGSSSGNIDCGCEEERGESQEVVQNLETSSPDHAERVSSSLSISEKLQSIVEEQELKWLRLWPDIMMAMKLLFHVKMRIKKYKILGLRKRG